MNYFLIDYENVHCEGIKKLKERNDIKDGDTLIIFFSDKCQNISLDVFDEDFLKGIEYHSFKAFVGTPNALDFQLSSYLGYLICKNSLQDTKSDANYYIVANDEGYDCLCDYWQKNFSVNVSRISTLATLKEIKNYLSDDDQPDKVLEIFNKYKTKQAIKNGLDKEFKDSKKAGSIYNKLKPLIKEKHKS